MRGCESYEVVSRDYYEWLLSQVNMQRGCYKRLMKLLHETQYSYILSRDGNRAMDGEDLKYRFAYERGYSYNAIEDTLGRPCSMLEMMVALCIRCQEYIVVDCADNRLGSDLFMDMLKALRLDQFVDARFNEYVAEDAINDFLAGYGPIFGVYDGRQRKEELWDQAMRHLNELVFEGSMTL